MQTVKGVKVRCIKLLKNKVYKFARYTNKYLNLSFYKFKQIRIKIKSEPTIEFFSK